MWFAKAVSVSVSVVAVDPLCYYSQVYTTTSPPIHADFLPASLWKPVDQQAVTIPMHTQLVEGSSLMLLICLTVCSILGLLLIYFHLDPDRSTSTHVGSSDQDPDVESSFLMDHVNDTEYWSQLLTNMYQHETHIMLLSQDRFDNSDEEPRMHLCSGNITEQDRPIISKPSVKRIKHQQPLQEGPPADLPATTVTTQYTNKPALAYRLFYYYKH